MAHQRLQRPVPALGQIAHLFAREQRVCPRPCGSQCRPLCAIDGEGIDLDAMGKRHGGVAAGKLHLLAGRPPIPRSSGRETAEIIETDLRRGKAGKLRGRLCIEVAQEAIAESMVLDRVQLLLDALERAAKLAPAR